MSILYQLGELQFESTRLGPHAVETDGAADFAEKDVIGVLKPAEFTGEGDDEIKFTCLLPGPEMVDRGIGAIAILDQMRVAGIPQILVRGDGISLGWRRITKAHTRERWLDRDGLGKVIEFDLTLKKTPRPSARARLALIYTLLSRPGA